MVCLNVRHTWLTHSAWCRDCISHSCILHTSYFILHIACLALKTSVTAGIKGRPCNTTNRKKFAATNHFYIARNCAKKSILMRTKIPYKRSEAYPLPPRSRTERGLPQAEAFEVRLGTLQLGAPGERNQQTARHGRHWQNARHQLVCFVSKKKVYIF